MTHIIIAFLALGALVTVLAMVFAIQDERPRLRRVGFALLAAIALAILAIYSQRP